MEKKENEKENLKTMKDQAVENFTVCLKNLKTTKETLSKAEEKISHLINDNHKLKVRAAVSFDELTPRPSFQQVKKKKKKNFFVLGVKFLFLKRPRKKHCAWISMRR